MIGELEEKSDFIRGMLIPVRYMRPTRLKGINGVLKFPH
jgi:hypothetical protein